MKKYTVYGNCQAKVLPSVLGSSRVFKDNFEYVDTPAVHRMNTAGLDKLIKDIVPEIELFIYQPISESYASDRRYSTNFLLEKLRKECVTISFPSCFFRGYNPEMDYLRNERNAHMTDCLDYHDRNIVFDFLRKPSFSSLEEDLNDPEFYTQAVSRKSVSKSLSELGKRESNIAGSDRGLDVRISEFVRRNYKKQRLFHTINHPSKAVFKFIGYQILSILGIEDLISFNKDPLSHTSYPIYRSHFDNLNLEFEQSSLYKINNESYEPSKLGQRYFDYYKKIPKEVLERNATAWLVS